MQNSSNDLIDILKSLYLIQCEICDAINDIETAYKNKTNSDGRNRIKVLLDKENELLMSFDITIIRQIYACIMLGSISISIPITSSLFDNKLKDNIHNPRGLADNLGLLCDDKYKRPYIVNILKIFTPMYIQNYMKISGGKISE